MLRKRSPSLMLAALLATVWAALVGAAPEPTPAPAADRPPMLPAVVAALAAEVMALPDTVTGCFVSPPAADDLIEGYATRVLTARLSHSGVKVRTVSSLPRISNGVLPEALEPSLLECLGPGGPSVLVWITATRSTAGPPRLGAGLYDALTGHRLGTFLEPFDLPADLQALDEGQATGPDAHDRAWLELFEEMFRPFAPDRPGSDELIRWAEGAYLLENGLWSAAAARFLAGTPATPSPAFLHGVFALQLAGDREEAAGQMREALKLHADNAPLNALNSWLHLRGPSPEDALPLLDQARTWGLAREGLYVYAHGLIMSECEDVDAARKDFARAAQMLPGVRFVHVRLARLYRNEGRMADAASAYRLALAADGSCPELWAEAASALDVADLTDEAVEALQTAFAMRRDDTLIARQLASLLARQGRHTEVMDVLRQAALARPWAAEGHAAYGDAAVRMWRLDEAEEAFRRSIQADPAFAYAIVRLAAVMQIQRRYGEARQLLTDLLDALPQSPGARIQLARLLGELRRVDEAIAMLEEAVKTPEMAAEARLAMVRVWLASNRDDRVGLAVRNAQKAVATEESARTYAALSEAFLVNGQSDNAYEAAASAMERDPASEAARLALARALDARGKGQEARKEAAKALEANPFSVEALRLMAAFAYADGDFPQCAELRRRALELNPWDADLHEFLAHLLADKLEDPAGAIEHYRKCIELRKMRDSALP